MQTIEINGSLRTTFGKKESRTERKEGKVPCVIYGNGPTVHFTLDQADIRKLVYTPNSYIVNINIDGKTEPAVMREVQFHPVSDSVIHIDFYRVDHKHPVTIEIPVRLVGVSEGVRQGGKMLLSKRKLKVSGIIDKFTDTLDVDVTSLELGKSIFVGDVQFDGLTILTPATTAICAVKMTRAARGAAAAATENK